SVLTGPQQRFLPQGLDQTKNRPVSVIAHRDNRLRRFEREAAAKDGALGKGVSLRWRQQLPGPLDRAAQSGLPRSGAARARGQERKRLGKALGHLRRAEHVHPRPGKLECQWDSLEAANQLRGCPRLLWNLRITPAPHGSPPGLNEMP